MKEKAINEAKERGSEIKDQELYELTDKIIRDLEILLDLYL
ncbi:MAG: hypothetical protein ACFFA3_21225 [Promethearchaeota archaeon]